MLSNFKMKNDKFEIIIVKQWYKSNCIIQISKAPLVVYTTPVRGLEHGS